MHWLTIHDHNRQRWTREPEKSAHVKNFFKPMLIQPQSHDRLFDEAMKYVRQMKNVAVAFSDIVHPTRSGAFNIFSGSPEKEKVVRFSEKLVRLGVLRPFTPVLIAVRLKYAGNAKKYLEAVQLCEKYAFRVFRVARGRRNNSEAVLFRLANQLYSGTLSYEGFLAEFRRDLHKRCNDTLLEQSFSIDHLEPWYGQRGLKYFLYEYEEHLHGGQVPIVSWEAIVKGSSKTIEHILPQNPEAGSEWTKSFTPEQVEQYKHLLGNLTLTEGNSSLGRKPFHDKKGKVGQRGYSYANSNLRIERELAGVDDWTPSKIEKRQQRLAAWAAQRWHVEQPPASPPKSARDKGYSLAKIEALADEHGVRDLYDALVAAFAQHGILVRPWRRCVSIAPPRRKQYALGVIYPERGRVKVGIWQEKFPRFFQGISNEDVRAVIGPTYHYIDRTNIDDFLDRLAHLFDKIR